MNEEPEQKTSVNHCHYCGEQILAGERFNLVQIHFRCQDLAKAPDVERLKQFLDKHQKVTRHYWGGSIVDKLFAIVKHYEQAALTILEAQKQQRDDEIVYLRALAMILQNTCNAGSHHWKQIRLAGCIEMIESGINKLHEMTFEVSRAWGRHPDLFACDYPIRQYLDRIHELEREIVKLTGKNIERDMVQVLEEEESASNPPF